MLNISPALIGSNPINVTILQWLTGICENKRLMSTSREYSQKKRSWRTKVAGDHLVFMSARIRQDLSVMDYNQTRQEKIIGILK